MKRLRILTVCTVLLAGMIFFLKKRSPVTIAAGEGLIIKKEWLAINKNSQTPIKDRRPGDQTFLTFPEWYLVFSPDEQAQYYKKHTATSFPYMSHTRQIWESYKIVKDQIKDNFPPNNGYHFMIWVIGSSASLEYGVKALYETLVGRMTDTHELTTAEDKFNAKFTQDYVDFIKDRPWYEFDFKTSLKDLWTKTTFFGDHFIRKIERRYILTSELLVKYGYGKLIGLGTKQVYGEALPTTAVIVEGRTTGLSGKGAGEPDGHTALLLLPRYDRFTAAAVRLARQGYFFKEIAGNNSAILLTILVPSQKIMIFKNAQIVFTQPISSDTGLKRVALAVKVSELNELLLELTAEQIQIEHVFDF